MRSKARSTASMVRSRVPAPRSSAWTADRDVFARLASCAWLYPESRRSLRNARPSSASHSASVRAGLGIALIEYIFLDKDRKSSHANITRPVDISQECETRVTTAKPGRPPQPSRQDAGSASSFGGGLHSLRDALHQPRPFWVDAEGTGDPFTATLVGDDKPLETGSDASRVPADNHFGTLQVETVLIADIRRFPVLAITDCRAEGSATGVVTAKLMQCRRTSGRRRGCRGRPHPGSLHG